MTFTNKRKLKTINRPRVIKFWMMAIKCKQRQNMRICGFQGLAATSFAHIKRYISYTTIDMMSIEWQISWIHTKDFIHNWCLVSVLVLSEIKLLVSTQWAREVWPVISRIVASRPINSQTSDMVDDTSAKFNKQDTPTYITYSIAWHWRRV